MVFGVLGSALLYLLFAVGLGGALGDQLGKLLGKDRRLFGGIGAGIGLLTLVTVLWIQHRSEPEAPPPRTASPHSVVDSERFETPLTNDRVVEDLVEETSEIVASAPAEVDSEGFDVEERASTTRSDRRTGLTGALGE